MENNRQIRQIIQNSNGQRIVVQVLPTSGQQQQQNQPLVQGQLQQPLRGQVPPRIIQVQIPRRPLQGHVPPQPAINQVQIPRQPLNRPFRGQVVQHLRGQVIHQQLQQPLRGQVPPIPQPPRIIQGQIPRQPLRSQVVHQQLQQPLRQQVKVVL